MRFLIIDDEIAQVESLILLLQMNGHTAAGAMNVADAKQLAVAHPPDAVILDICMPGGNGTGLIPWLREYDATAHILIVVSSALPHDFIPPIPADERIGYLAKPFSYGPLMKLVAKLGKANQSKEHKKL